MSRQAHDGPQATDAVRALYDGIASDYDRIVDAEIGQPVYSEALGGLAEAVRDLPGPVVDVACGSGQMLQRYRAEFDPDRPLVGLDLSPAMVALTGPKLGDRAEVRVADMRAPGVDGAAAILCWFALHHLDARDAARAIAAWFDALAPGGRLSLATWEGEGPIDYGEHAELTAWRYTAEAVAGWVRDAGFAIERRDVRPVPDMGMDAVYLDATRPGAD